MAHCPATGVLLKLPLANVQNPFWFPFWPQNVIIIVVEMVKLHAFRHSVLHYQIMIEFIFEVICKVPFIVICSLFPLGLVLLSAFNPSNAELNPICPLLALFGAHHILHISRKRVKLFYAYTYCFVQEGKWSYRIWASSWNFDWKVTVCVFVVCWGTELMK